MAVRTATLTTARTAPAPARTGSSCSTFLIESDTKSSSSASSSGADTSLYSTEVAHSRYRGNDAVLLRHRTHALHRAHLRPLSVHMLLEPLVVGPALLHHPIQIATQLARRRRLRLWLAFRAQEMAIVCPHGTGRQLQRDDDLDQDPLEPAIVRLASAAVRGFASGTPGRWYEPGVRGEFMTRPKPIDRTDLRLDEQRAEHADAGHGRQLLHHRIVRGRALHVAVEARDLSGERVMQGE